MNNIISQLFHMMQKPERKKGCGGGYKQAEVPHS